LKPAAWAAPIRWRRAGRSSGRPALQKEVPWRRCRPCWSSWRWNRTPKGNQQSTPDRKERDWPRPSGGAAENPSGGDGREGDVKVGSRVAGTLARRRWMGISTLVGVAMALFTSAKAAALNGDREMEL
jgi:hypothetical protein